MKRVVALIALLGILTGCAIEPNPKSRIDSYAIVHCKNMGGDYLSKRVYPWRQGFICYKDVLEIGRFWSDEISERAWAVKID